MIFMENKHPNMVDHQWSRYPYCALMDIDDINKLFDVEPYPNIGADMKSELRIWLNENIDYEYKEDSMFIFFKTNEDAIAFKLRWC